MKINTWIIVGLALLTPVFHDYLNNSLYVTDFVLISMSLFFIVSGLFGIRNYQNKNRYLAIVAVIIASSLILTYIQLSSQAYQGNKLFDSVYPVIVSLLIIGTAYNFMKEWITLKADVKWVNYFLIAYIIFMAFIQLIFVGLPMI